MTYFDLHNNKKRILDLDAVFGYQFGNVILVCAPTGVYYTAQVGGKLCLHPEVEGFPFLSPLHGIDAKDCPAICMGGNEVSRKKFADELDAILSEGEGYITARFDYSRIEQLTEGWWPILFNGTGKDYLDGHFENSPAWLYTGNCD